VALLPHLRPIVSGLKLEGGGGRKKRRPVTRPLRLLLVDETAGRRSAWAASDLLRKWAWARVLEFRQRIGDLALIAEAGGDARVGRWAA
jgi:hypothetical protein